MRRPRHGARGHRRRDLVRYGVGIASLAVARGFGLAEAATCAATGGAPPGVITLMASKDNPATDAWVVTPQCTYTTVTLEPSEETVGPLIADALSLERVVSVPTDTLNIEITGNSLSRGADFSAARQAVSLILSSVPTDPTSLILPPYLRKINFLTYYFDVQTLDGVKFPATLETLKVSQAKITSYKGVALPAKLTEIHLDGAPALTTLDMQFPAALVLLSVSDAKVAKFERVVLPSALESFSCYKCGMSIIRGVRWPASLKILNLDGNPITTFEVRRSDLAILKKAAFTAKVTQSACSGTLESAGTISLCVISDSDFDSLYGGGSNSSPTSSPSIGSNGSSQTPSSTKSKGSSSGGSGGGGSIGGGDAASPGATAGGSVSGDASTSTTGGSSLATPSDSASNETVIGPDGKPQKVTNTPTLSSRSPQDSPSVSAMEGNQSGSSSSMLIIVVSSATSLVVAGVIFLIFVISRRRRKPDAGASDSPTATFEPSDTPHNLTTPHAHKESGSSTTTVTDSRALDFRNDKELLRSRIDHVQLGSLIARGGYGVVYRGSFEGRDVAIKQMLPDAWRSDSMIAAFVDEVRMCARLDHPKVVEFIGVSWTRVRDLSVVTELMPGGDLHSVLRKYPLSSGQEWTTSWSPQMLRNKTLIATDVAEAVVYLHSFNSPIIHRDLKAKNVLLDLEGNAKLSDFGISRTVSLDETMTSEIGTAAWIAPEVLRGERYSEKADIYSLGVLLVELDRCRHPYANEPVLLMGSSVHGGIAGTGRGDTSHVAHKNTQIAVLVSTGKLRPSVSVGCPENVAALVGRCLSYEASARPTAMEVFYELRQIRKSVEAAA